MNQEDLVFFGQIIRTHGNNGALVIKKDVHSKAKLKNSEPVFVDIQPTPVPFSIEQLLNETNGFLTLKFEYVNSPEKASSIIGLNVFLERKAKPSSKEFQPNDIIGFSVTDKEFGNIGIITAILEMPQQDIFQIENKGKEILIPANEDFINKIDRKNKKVEISAPEGLINLYLE